MKAYEPGVFVLGSLHCVPANTKHHVSATLLLQVQNNADSNFG